MIPILGFLPDVDPATPGCLVDCENFIPSEKGMVAAPAPIAAISGLPALGSECRGAAVLVDTTGARRNFAATQTAISEIVGSAWVDRSRGGGYTGSAENRVVFAQFGNVALAANTTEVIQFSVSGAFADIATAPKAKIILGAKDFVLAFATNDGTYGDQPDRWWCSAFQDYSSWTPSLTTQATTGRLVGVPGPITAAAMLGAYAVAYKERGAYLGQYAGPPAVWQWDQVPGEFGCVGQDAVVDVGGAHFVVGPDNFWLYDGTRPVAIGVNEVRQWFFNDLSATYKFRTIVHFDREYSRVWVIYPSKSSGGTPDRALVYNIISKRWGRANRVVEAVFQFISPGLTWGTSNTVIASWGTAPSIPWGSPAWKASGRTLAIFDSSHTLYTLTGVAGTSTWTTGDMGADDVSSYTERFIPHYILAPSSATATGYTKETPGGTFSANGSETLADGKFDVRQDARWHRYSVTQAGACELRGITPTFKITGIR